MSRRNSPKQFTPLIGSRSSIQLAIERLTKIVEPDRLFIGTNRAYSDLLREQLPQIPTHNYILEPSRQDVAAAVALAFFSLERDGVSGPVVFQWSDHYVKRPEELLRLFAAGRSLIESERAQMVIIAQEPGSANDNLGWIQLEAQGGTASGVPYYAFGDWLYRPERSRCEAMYASGGWVWNTGHFVTSVEFMTSSFRSRAAGLATVIEEIVSYRGTPDEQAKLDELYPRIEPNSFDDVILRQIPRHQACLLKADLGWIDPGNLNSLKEALEGSPGDTVTRGEVISLRTEDAFIYNGTDRPVAVMGASNLIVVEMPDVTLVIDKGSVRDLGELLRELESRGLGDLL